MDKNWVILSVKFNTQMSRKRISRNISNTCHINAHRNNASVSIQRAMGDYTEGLRGREPAKSNQLEESLLVEVRL